MLMSLPVSELKNYSLLTLTLPANYGYCIFVAFGSICVVEWKSRMVQQARKQYNVPYPIMHSNEEFNMVISAYQKMLDRYPQFLSLLLLGGLDSPLISATGGTILILGKIASFLGCGKADTKKHVCCAFECAGWLAMAYSTSKLALRLLQVI